MTRKKIGVWRKPECSGILCGYGLHYDPEKDRTYCYEHGWVMNGNIEGFPMPITEDDFNVIIESVREKGVKFRETQ